MTSSFFWRVVVSSGSSSLYRDGQFDLRLVGQELGVTRERIRQIESKTMSKLRHPSRSQVLRDYLD